MQKTKPCVCGHAHDAHEHYRRGTDCAICGAQTCPKYRASRATKAGPTDGAPTRTPEQSRGNHFEAAPATLAAPRGLTAPPVPITG